MLEKEFQYYLDHQAELLKGYTGKFLVIKDEKVAGSYSTHKEAYNDAVKRFALGTFLIQRCTPGSRDYTQTYNSQVIINRI